MWCKLVVHGSVAAALISAAVAALLVEPCWCSRRFTSAAPLLLAVASGHLMALVVRRCWRNLVIERVHDGGCAVYWAFASWA